MEKPKAVEPRATKSYALRGIILLGATIKYVRSIFGILVPSPPLSAFPELFVT